MPRAGRGARLDRGDVPLTVRDLGQPAVPPGTLAIIPPFGDAPVGATISPVQRSGPRRLGRAPEAMAL